MYAYSSIFFLYKFEINAIFWIYVICSTTKQPEILSVINYPEHEMLFKLEIILSKERRIQDVYKVFKMLFNFYTRLFLQMGH